MEEEFVCTSKMRKRVYAIDKRVNKKLKKEESK